MLRDSSVFTKHFISSSMQSFGILHIESESAIATQAYQLISCARKNFGRLLSLSKWLSSEFVFSNVCERVCETIQNSRSFKGLWNYSYQLTNPLKQANVKNLHCTWMELNFNLNSAKLYAKVKLLKLHYFKEFLAFVSELRSLFFPS